MAAEKTSAAAAMAAAAADDIDPSEIHPVIYWLGAAGAGGEGFENLTKDELDQFIVDFERHLSLHDVFHYYSHVAKDFEPPKLQHTKFPTMDECVAVLREVLPELIAFQRKYPFSKFMVRSWVKECNDIASILEEGCYASIDEIKDKIVRTGAPLPIEVPDSKRAFIDNLQAALLTMEQRRLAYVKEVHDTCEAFTTKRHA